MKAIGVIVTTLIEHVDVDLPDDLPESEVGELFMRIAMTLSSKTLLSKQVQFCPLARGLPDPPTENKQPTNIDPTD
jgi:hypothetical protein